MSNDNQQFDSLIDNEQLNEQDHNDQFYVEPPQFEASHTANIIEKLIHLSRFGNLLTLIVGNNGSGKSWLIDDFIAATDESSLICHIKSHPLLSIDQLFQQVTKSFAGETTFAGIPLTANQYEEWAEQLTSFLGNRILIIDDAEVLSTSVLHELCKLSAMQQDKETPHLHMVLSGNYDLNNILEQASQGILDEEGIYAIDIPALSDEESGRWLDYLFAETGVIFLPEEDELEQMLSNGQGNLSLLKTLAEEYASEHNDIKEFEDEHEPWRVSVIGYWFASLTIVIMLVLGLFFYQDELVELTGFADTKDAQLTPEKQDVLFVSDKIESEKVDSNNMVSDIVDSDNVVSEQALPMTDSKIIFEDTAVDSGEIVTEEAVDAEPMVADSIIDESTIEEPKDEVEQSLLIESNPIQTSEQIETDVQSAEVNTAEKILTKVVERKAASTLTADEEFLMSGSNDDYVVQIIAVSKEETARSFIQKHSRLKMLYYKRSLSGKALYTVVLVGFKNKLDATKARSELSDELKKNGPWIKRLSLVKNEILTAQKRTND